MTSERRNQLREIARFAGDGGNVSKDYLDEALDALDAAERKLEAMYDKRDDEIDREAWARGMEDAAKIADAFIVKDQNDEYRRGICFAAIGIGNIVRAKI